MKRIPFYLIATLIFNTAIAGVLTLLMPGIPFWHEFIYSQCIGLAVVSINLLVVNYAKAGVRRWAIFAISLPFSVVIGMTLAFAFTGVGTRIDEQDLQTMVLGLFFGFIGIITVLLSERVEAEVKQRQLIKSESEKREIEAHLKLLQAQIEPHFLFNTLANVSSLIDSDPALAHQLLDRLNDWLRVALARARSEHLILGDELDMLSNYMNILNIRFGERLRWRIDADTAVRQIAFPPMLLQPLVENAVRHGIEPKLGGGEIVIRAVIENGKLHISVCDSGVGLQENAGSGAGLGNVRARLAALFGTAGKLTLENNAAGGTTATLELSQ